MDGIASSDETQHAGNLIGVAYANCLGPLEAQLPDQLRAGYRGRQATARSAYGGSGSTCRDVRVRESHLRESEPIRPS